MTKPAPASSKPLDVRWWRQPEAMIAASTFVAIALYAAASLFDLPPRLRMAPLIAALVAGGVPLLVSLARQVLRGEFGADLLAGISIITAVLLGQPLVGAVVVLMLSGGQALEGYATRRASAVLDALARRSPSVAHRRRDEQLVDVPLDAVGVGDELIVLPHELCPVDGVVTSGDSTMDESYLSGEPFQIRKTAGAQVISGAINGDGALTIVAERLAVDSRYARIMAIVRTAEERRPPMRRLADRLGAFYTPLAVAIAGLGWVVSGDPNRFLAVLVIATPCPLLLAIPTAIIGAVSLAARRSILIRDPAVLERIGTCRTMMFDKTGTLTLGRPAVTDVVACGPHTRLQVLAVAASLEQYSRHPLASAILDAALREGAVLLPVSDVGERPGQGLTGHVGAALVRVTGRSKLSAEEAARLPAEFAGLECVVVIDDAVAGLIRFRDVPRAESGAFVRHLRPLHHIRRLMLVSGDRESEVRYLAEVVGITDVYFSQTPEQKVALVRAAVAEAPTLFVGDGLNDAPAMLSATVGIALGQSNAVTAEAAGAVILDGSLSRVDELMHISQRARRVALQSAIGGMAASVIGMGFAVAGLLPPLAGALAQELIDVLAVLNALRTALKPRDLTDF